MLLFKFTKLSMLTAASLALILGVMPSYAMTSQQYEQESNILSSDDTLVSARLPNGEQTQVHCEGGETSDGYTLKGGVAKRGEVDLGNGIKLPPSITTTNGSPRRIICQGGEILDVNPSGSVDFVDDLNF